MDLFSGFPERPQRPAERVEPHVFTISQVTQMVREVLEETIGEIAVEGEVSNYRKQPSGHQYFTLKDENSQLQCVMFARPGMWRKTVILSDGMHVIARGRLTVYESRGQYQLNVQSVQAGGAGLLQARFEALKQKLSAEGLFDPSRKRPLPPFPVAVGIVTSPAAAALRDILNVLSRRAQWLRVVISPVRVQGEGAAQEIAKAVDELNRFEELGLHPVDVIIVTRGGGSIEDLWEFNEEIVARAIANSAIPVISAVGHEIDFTIADFAADLRAPTPSAAAELVAPDRAELQRRLEQTLGRLRRHVAVCLTEEKQRLSVARRSALLREPQRRWQEAVQRLDTNGDNLRRGAVQALNSRREKLRGLESVLKQHRPDQLLALRRHQLEAFSSRLDALTDRKLQHLKQKLASCASCLRLVSPQATLERGYTITSSARGVILHSAEEAAAAKALVTQFADGKVESGGARMLPESSEG